MIMNMVAFKAMVALHMVAFKESTCMLMLSKV